MTVQHLRNTAAHLNRLRLAFTCVAVLTAFVCIATLIAAAGILIGDHAALQPVVMDGTDPLPPPGALPLVFAATTLATAFLLAVAVFFWLPWLGGSFYLARKAGARDMRFSEAKAVIWHFVPVMSYIMPMLAMIELEAATKNPAGWQALQPSRLASTTWLIAKMSGLGLVASFGLSGSASTAGGYVRGVVFFSVSTVFVIAGLGCAVAFMRRISMLQARYRTVD